MTLKRMRPEEIEGRSMEIIGEELARLGPLPPADCLPVVKRVIHATADFDYRQSLWFSPGAVAAGVAALASGDYLERSRKLIREERAFLAGELEKLGLAPCPSQANYLLFYSPEDLFAPLLERGVLIRDCSNYHGLGPGWYRAAVRTREENLRFLEALRKTIP